MEEEEDWSGRRGNSVKLLELKVERMVWASIGAGENVVGETFPPFHSEKKETDIENGCKQVNT